SVVVFVTQPTPVCQSREITRQPKYYHRYCFFANPRTSPRRIPVPLVQSPHQPLICPATAPKSLCDFQHAARKVALQPAMSAISIDIRPSRGATLPVVIPPSSKMRGPPFIFWPSRQALYRRTRTPACVALNFPIRPLVAPLPHPDASK